MKRSAFSFLYLLVYISSFIVSLDSCSIFIGFYFWVSFSFLLIGLWLHHFWVSLSSYFISFILSTYNSLWWKPRSLIPATIPIVPEYYGGEERESYYLPASEIPVIYGWQGIEVCIFLLSFYLFSFLAMNSHREAETFQHSLCLVSSVGM